MNLADWCLNVCRDWWSAVIDESLHFQSWSGFYRWVGEYALLFPAGMCVILIVFALLYALLRESRLPWRSDFTPSLAVVVPARNEQLGIAATIRSLLAQNYPRLSIHVVSDASTDNTAHAARAFSSQGVIVHELASRHGKAAALQYALDRISADLYMVVDADTIAEPRALHAMVQQFADPRIAGVTGSPRVANTSALLTAMQAMEYIGIIGIIKRADSFWGGLFTVSGAAACFRTSILRAVGGWHSDSVTEDIELSWRMQKAGHELAFEPRAQFMVQAPQSLPALYRQRTRWARGMFEVLRLHGNLAFTANAALIPMAATVLGTVLWMLFALLTTFMFLVNTAIAVFNHLPFDHHTALRVLAVTTGLFVAQTILACTWESHYRRGLWRFVPLSFLFPLYYWIIIIPSFVLGIRSACLSSRSSSATWERTARSAADPRPTELGA